jgi:hypothetical protein
MLKEHKKKIIKTYEFFGTILHKLSFNSDFHNILLQYLISSLNLSEPFPKLV